ncbi:hypothetical protein [Pedobacter aquatilis]|uniref:hypothetical protein n=1 Tax=Pedobacter aquatilis TaxID=351343 RepID=UPI00292FEC62|nr:hypothetical protein [Pedobacter aquatilis]
MKAGILKYVLLYCFAIALLFKTSGVISVVINSVKNIAYSIDNQDSTEKEEKKIEHEYFNTVSIISAVLKTPVQLDKKIVLPEHNFLSSYFPEVLTPPPALEA